MRCCCWKVDVDVDKNKNMKMHVPMNGSNQSQMYVQFNSERLIAPTAPLQVTRGRGMIYWLCETMKISLIYLS